MTVMINVSTIERGEGANIFPIEKRKAVTKVNEKERWNLKIKGSREQSGKERERESFHASVFMMARAGIIYFIY
jgi:hypothetical protein